MAGKLSGDATFRRGKVEEKGRRTRVRGRRDDQTRELPTHGEARTHALIVRGVGVGKIDHLSARSGSS